MRKAIALGVSTVLAFSLAGCSGPENSQDADMAGSYEISHVSNGTDEYTAETIQTLGLADFVTMDIAEGNAGTLSAFGTDFEISLDPAQNKATITTDGRSETIDCAIDGDQVTFDMDGKTLTLAKQ